MTDKQGNKLVTEQRWDEAVKQYTRAISLDPRKTIFFSNRAVSLNALGQFEKAEADCKVILSREAQSDVQEVLKQGEHPKARLMAEEIKKEVAKLPKQSREEVLNF
jgi:tetratricopeptide (TPR) repeat protein